MTVLNCPDDHGFTLIEVIVAVAIVTILLALALPGYQGQVQKTRRSLGGAELLRVMMRQEQHFVDHKRYAGILTELGFPSSPYAIDAEGNAADAIAGNRIYLINIATHRNNCTLYAIPQLSQAPDRECGTLSLDSMGTKLASGPGAVQECW